MSQTSRTSGTAAPASRPVYRHLSPVETDRLERQGCRCREWNSVTVEEPFDPTCYRNVEFSGEVTLGSVGDTPAEAVAGIPRRRGIYDAVVAGCRIGRDVYIHNVKGGLLNLDIESGAVIDSVHSIVCRGETCFGNDVKVNVMSETGGREVVINTGMSAPLAYMTAFYRHSASLSKALDGMAARFAGGKRSSRGHVGNGAEIVNCGDILNVDVRAGARLHGAAGLTNGTVGRAFVGTGVIAVNFIIQDGATVDSAARLHGCLVGHCSTVASGFTAHDTLVFTNSRLENGESAAAFCGPFTTSMHKSTLLIGGLFSFFNAGSGTNQSNHLYKLGPMHQGILARGCKTGSGSYIMWPAAVGAFSTVTGRHHSHPDTRLFPFSYLVNDPGAESGSATVLIPGAAVGSAGLARDVEKWPSRIGGEAEDDPVNFNWLSPFTLQYVLKGLRLLNQWNGEMAGDPYIGFNGTLVPASRVAKAIDRYRLLLRLFAAGVFRRKILAVAATNPEKTPDELLGMLREEPSAEGAGDWVDLCGMLAPREAVDRLTDGIISTPGITTGEVNGRLAEIDSLYHAYSWSWLWHNLHEAAGVPATHLTLHDLTGILSEGADAAARLEALFIKDASKEFDPENATPGFGIDAGDNRQEIRDDFERTRGLISSQRFPAMLHRRVETFRRSVTDILTLLDSGF